MEASLQSTGHISSKKQVFVRPQETLDHPFDVTLVVEDGKEFKGHRRVLSEASPFFEKLLNSDMRESKEGVVRLEMLTERGLKDILEYIYTGSVQLSPEGNAQELIVNADFLVLQHLKTLAENCLVKNLNASTSLATYYFAERYRCEVLLPCTRDFIFSNFTTVAKSDEFLKLSDMEVKTWISSDEINVSAEEDVLKVILTWIDHQKSKRSKYFEELFREVRLVFVSREYLQSDIATNDLVKGNEDCMDLVKDALNFIDSNSCPLSVKPRKSLEIPVVLVFMKTIGSEQERVLCCYYPREKRWSRFLGRAPPNTTDVISCRGKLYFINQRDNSLLRYDSFSNRWKLLPFGEQRKSHNIFVRNGDEMYALVSLEDQRPCPECASLRFRKPCGKRHLSFITKYKPESNSWEDVTTFDLGWKDRICVVAKGNFIYFLGGFARGKILKDADTYDLGTNTWRKIADMQQPREDAFGTAAYGKVFISGGYLQSCESRSQTCEVYHETTNEWHFIAEWKTAWFCSYRSAKHILVGADSKVYLLTLYSRHLFQEESIDCYEPEINQWITATKMAIMWDLLPWSEFDISRISNPCSMRVFAGCKFLFEQASFADITNSNMP